MSESEAQNTPVDVRRVARELQKRVDKAKARELDVAKARLERAGWVCLPPPEPLNLDALGDMDAMEADMPPLLCMTCACRIANGTFHTAAGDAPHRPDVPALGPDGKCSHCGAQGQALDGDDLDG